MQKKFSNKEIEKSLNIWYRRDGIYLKTKIYPKTFVFKNFKKHFPGCAELHL